MKNTIGGQRGALRAPHPAGGVFPVCDRCGALRRLGVRYFATLIADVEDGVAPLERDRAAAQLCMARAAPIPGVGPWQQVLLMPGIWHFHFNRKYAEQLTAGRERIYLNRIWDDFAFHPERITEAERTRTAARTRSLEICMQVSLTSPASIKMRMTTFDLRRRRSLCQC